MANKRLKEEVLELADSMVAAAASFNAQGYMELINTRELLEMKLNALILAEEASEVLNTIIKIVNPTPKTKPIIERRVVK